jgi:hypothetical protein
MLPASAQRGPADGPLRGGPVAAPPQPAGDSQEVMLANLSCSSSSTTVHVDFRATGGALQGLQRDPVQGGNITTPIFFPVVDCQAVLTRVRDLAADRDCATASGFGGSISLMCQARRDAIIQTVGGILRIAFSEASAP